MIYDDIPIYESKSRYVVTPTFGEESSSPAARNENNLNTGTQCASLGYTGLGNALNYWTNLIK